VRPSWQTDIGSLAGTGATADYPIVVTAPDTIIAASIVIPGWDINSALPDFDLQLFDPNGQPVNLSEDILRQEDVSYRATTTGTYTVRVLSFEGAGSFFLERSTLALSLVANAGSPQFLGTAMPGHTLIGLPGAWNGVPFPQLRSLWMRCFPDGFGCDTIFGANYPTFVVPQPTVSPQNTDLPPQVNGIQAVGETLVASSPGSWRNPDAYSLRYFVRAHNHLNRFPNPEFVIAVSPAREVTIPITFAYQWQRCIGWPPVCEDIPGQVSPSYLLTPADEGTRIQLRVRATNGAGSTDAYAVISYPIAPPRWSPPRTEPPPFTPPPRPPDVTPPPPPPGGTRPTTPLPDLHVTAVANPPPPSAPPAGTPITYTITIENRSDVYASLVTLTGSGPWNLTNFTATTTPGVDGASCTVPFPGSNTFTCDLRALRAHTTKQVTVTGTVSAQVYMTFSTWATMLQPDANPADDSVSIIHG
jgi:hypothetical protein